MAAMDENESIRLKSETKPKHLETYFKTVAKVIDVKGIA
jgi:hypothetical protein